MEETLFRIGKDAIAYNEKYRKVNWNGFLNLQNPVPLIQFPALSHIDFIRHGFSTRLGGASSGSLASLNLSFTRGDDPANVMENYRRICQAMEMTLESLVFSDQIHETEVKAVGWEDAIGQDMEAFSRGEKKLAGYDGLITNQPGLGLVTSYADCVPLFFVDVAKKAIGLSHSGWRGTVKRMGAKTVAAMEREYGTRPSDLTCVIGPSICQDCYEVSQDVYLSFQSQFTQEQTEEILLPKDGSGGEKFQLDLWKANQIILMEAGVPRENISMAGICTCCNSSLLYSHRKTNGKRGNLQAFLMIQ